MKRVPPAILLAVACSFVSLVVSVALRFYLAELASGSAWIPAIGAALGLAGYGLFAVGMLELRQRLAAIGFATLSTLVLVSVLLMDPPPWIAPAIRVADAYGPFIAQLLVMCSLAASIWKHRPVLALCAVACAILPLPAMAHLIDVDHRVLFAVDISIRVSAFVLLLLISIHLASESVPQPLVAAGGLRHAAYAMCAFSAVAALDGLRAIDQPLLIAVASAATLSWAGLGVLRAASLQPWRLALAGTSLLFGAGLHVALMPRVQLHMPVPSLAPFMALVCLSASVFVRVALVGVVEKVQLQAKGMGAMFMFMTALMMQLLLVSPSHPRGAQIALGVLTGFSMALGAWMLSILCRYGAQRLEATDGDLPPARIV